MSQLPYMLYRASQVRELDRLAIEEFGISGIKLMTRAGTVVFDILRAQWPDAHNIIVVCGAGNNAGDGYVIARLAKESGLNVTVVTLSDPGSLKGDARLAWGECKTAGVAVMPFESGCLNHTDVIVDAIFGTGLDRDVTGAWAQAISVINQHTSPVIAVDIPSGLHADNGSVLGVAVNAQITVSFIGLKRGLFTGHGPDYCGTVLFDDLGIPKNIYEKITVDVRRFDWPSLKHTLSPRRKTSHKGDNGHVLVIGGNNGMAGAACMAAEAAARSGSGLTSVAMRPGYVAAMAAARPDIMWHGTNTPSDCRRAMRRATVIAIGPGLGTDRWAQQLLAMVIERGQSGLPLILDADALNLLAQEPYKHECWVLTPHPGEAARLLNCSVAEINNDRFGAVRQLQNQYGGVSVLKGAGTLVCGESGTISLCSEGNPGMAVGGMGDVLTGVVAALRAQGLSLSEAAIAGVALHASAGDRAAKKGETGMLASDLIAELRGSIN